VALAKTIVTAVVIDQETNEAREVSGPMVAAR